MELAKPAPISVLRNEPLLKTAIVLLAVSLAGCIGYVPGRQDYWDTKVKEMCEKDGGVTVYERIQLSREEYKRLGGIEGSIPLPNEDRSTSDNPYFRRVIDTKIREANPEVMRSETLVVRRSDGKLLGRSVRYWRRGGDAPTGLGHESSIICPERADLTKQIFPVRQGSQ